MSPVTTVNLTSQEQCVAAAHVQEIVECTAGQALAVVARVAADLNGKPAESVVDDQVLMHLSALRSLMDAGASRTGREGLVGSAKYAHQISESLTTAIDALKGDRS